MPKRKGTKDKQRSTKHTYKTKDRVTRTPLKSGGELGCSGRVSSSCSISDTCRFDLVTNPVVSREWGKDRKVFPTSGIYPWSFVTQIFHNGQPSHGGDRKYFEVLTSTLSKKTLGSVASLLATTLYQGNPDRNLMHTTCFWNNLLQVRSSQKIRTPNNLEVFESKKTKRPTHDIQTAYTWYPNGLHMISKRPTHDIQMAYTWYPNGIHMISKRPTHNIQSPLRFSIPESDDK